MVRVERRCITVLAILMCSWMVMAEDNHYFGISLQGAYATIRPYQTDVQSLHGGAGGAHCLYEYQHNHLLMNIGAGFVWQQTGWSVPVMIQLPNQDYIDTQGDAMTLQTVVKRWDEARRGVVDIPFLIGGEWGMGYLLGGVKVGLGVIDQSRLKAEITTTGTYDQYFVPIHDAANHGFYTAQPIEQAYTMPTELDVRASLEAGINLANIYTPAKVSVKVRLGAFVDYGFYVATVAANSTFIQHTGTALDLSTYHLQPILIDGSHLLDNLMAGVKLTMLIGAPAGSNHCPTCNILDNRWRPFKTKKRCVVCDHGY